MNNHTAVMQVIQGFHSHAVGRAMGIPTTVNTVESTGKPLSLCESLFSVINNTKQHKTIV